MPNFFGDFKGLDPSKPNPADGFSLNAIPGLGQSFIGKLGGAPANAGPASMGDQLLKQADKNMTLLTGTRSGG